MNTKSRVLAVALGLALCGGVSAASMSAAQAEDALIRRGFSNISMLEYQGGVWTAIATSADGKRVDVRLDPIDSRITTSANTRTTVTTTTTTTRPAAPPPVKVVERVVEKPVVVERIIEQPVVRQPIVVREQVLVPVGEKISKNDVRAVLAGAGYHDIHDIDWLSHRGVWKAEARDPYGDDREVHVDPLDARIVHVEDD
jgi:hypothetical protein